MPRYSVIITTHRRPALLARAIRSVQDQTLTGIQVIVVCDVACPETSLVASSLLRDDDFFVQRAGQPGPAASRNVGLRLADRDFVVFLDDDDAFTPDFFRDIDPHVSRETVLYTDFHVVFESSVETGCTPIGAESRSLLGRDAADLYIKNFIPLHCLIYPRAVLQERRFDPSLKLNEDWAFLLDVASTTSLRHRATAGPIIYTRERADNRGRSNDHLLVDTYRTVYRRWPAPTLPLKAARQAFLRDNGIEADLVDL